MALQNPMQMSRTREAVFQGLRELLASLAQMDTSLPAETVIEDDLGLESDLLTARAADNETPLERAFGIRLADAEVGRCATIGELADLVWHTRYAQETVGV